MKKLIVLIILISCSGKVENPAPSNVLLMEGQTFTNSDGYWEGVNITRNTLTDFTFRNNLITSVNTEGYMLQAGDDDSRKTNNNLDNAVIYGNKLDWNGEPGATLCHGIMAGYNINYDIRYNYIDGPFYGIVYEGGHDDGTTMINSSGGITYNIFKNCPIPIIVEGFENVYIYNNTFFYGLESPVDYSLIRLTRSNGTSIPVPCKNVKIKNNVFFSTSNVIAINIVNKECLTGFESDYNVYYWNGTSGNLPQFSIDGSNYTWSQWRALGYDKHSVIINPQFNDEFVPAARLNYGRDLGSDYIKGLSIKSTWLVGVPPDLKNQDIIWQTGARIY